MIATATATGKAEIFQVPNPKFPERPTSAIRLKRDNEFVINALQSEPKIVTPEVKKVT